MRSSTVVTSRPSTRIAGTPRRIAPPPGPSAATSNRGSATSTVVSCRP
jgi:hypothetical protein